MTLPPTMLAAVLYDVDDIRIEERALPVLGEGQLLVRTMASGICSGDVMAWYVRRKAPLVLGHEPAGIVAAVGSGTPPRDDDAREFAVGDRVFVHHHAPCFACRACDRGDFVQCATWRRSRIDPGGLAEYFCVPVENQRDTLRLPGDMSFTDACLIEPTACVVKSLRRGNVAAGDTVYVVGLGVMGLLHVLAGRALGARVFASDFIAERRILAERNGAIVCHPDDAAAMLGDGADVVICGPGTPQAIRSSLSAATPGGTVVLFAPLEPGTLAAFDLEQFYFADLRLVATYSCGPDDTRAALRLIEDGSISADKLGATTFPLGQTAHAYRELAACRIVKPIVLFESASHN